MKNVFNFIFITLSLISCGSISSTNDVSNKPSSFNTASTSTKETSNISTLYTTSPTTNQKSEQVNTTSSVPTSYIEVKYYTITFLNYDNSVLYIDSNVEEGTIPEYKGPTPTKEGSYNKRYIFNGWNNSLTKAYEDTTYIATFKEEDIYYTIEELVSFDGEYPLHYQKEVYLKDVGIVSVYASDTFCVTSIHDPLDFYSIEVKSKDSIKDIFTKNDVVTIVGTLDIKNGRPYINNATVTWGYDGDKYSSNNKAFIGTVKMEDREYWENNIKKEHSGSLYYSYMTIANVPTITSGENISFYITFPGEDIEISDNNFYLIEVRIPALTIVEAEYVSSWAKQFNDGDGIYINLQIYYDNKLMVLLPYDLINSNTYNTPYTHKNVYSNYNPVSEFLTKEYATQYVTFPSMSNEYTYNYTTKKAYETINNSSMKYGRISFYTYKKEELINQLFNLYSSNIDFTYMEHKEGKHWFSHPYSSNLDLYICFYEGFGKVIFETHFLI